jgi:hypothetical protein
MKVELLFVSSLLSPFGTNPATHSLQEHEFLNDIIINVYLKHLELELKEEARDKVKIFNSFFFSQYRKVGGFTTGRVRCLIIHWQHGFERVKRWTKNDKLFQKEFVIVPINERQEPDAMTLCDTDLHHLTVALPVRIGTLPSSATPANVMIPRLKILTKVCCHAGGE